MPDRVASRRPDWRDAVRRRLGPTADADRVEELAQHVELRWAALVAEGHAEDRAAALALAELPSAVGAGGEHADLEGPMWQPSRGVARATRDAWRALRHRPAYALLVAATLALGVGASVALFAVADAVLLRPLPYPDADRLVLLWGTDREGGVRGQVSAPDVADFARQASSLEGAAPFRSWRPIVGAHEGTDREPAMLVGAGYFATLGVRAQAGRLFEDADQEDGRDDVVVLSDALWRRRFAADPGIVGRTIPLNLRPHTVVGVLPPDALSLPAPLVDAPAQLYRPLGEPYAESQRDRRHVRGLARLKPGIGVDAAQAELALVAVRLAQAHPKTNADVGVRVVRLADDLRADLRRPLGLVLAGSVLLLLIACVNAGHLMLGEGVRRIRETAVRLALGASPARLTRQALVEGVLLSGLGAALGCALAWPAVAALRAMGTPLLPQLAAVAVDGRSVGFAFVASLATGAAAATLPALLSWRVSAAACLRTGSAPPGRGRTRRILVAVEVALAIVLATGAGLLLRSVDALWAVDPGFVWRGVSKVEVTLPSARYREPAQQRQAVARLDEALRALPGVDAAGVIAPLPLSGSFDQVGFEVEGQARPEGQEREADRYVVTPGALQALGLAPSAGRLLDARDAADAAPAVLVSETLARRVWPDTNPLGQRIRLPWNPGHEDKPWRTVVGVVRDLRHYGLDGEPTAQIYLPHGQYPVSFLTFVARQAEHDGRRTAVPSALRQAVREVDPELAPFDASSLESVLAESIALRRFVMALLAAFAMLAVVLAGLGLHGVVGQVVAERSREVAVRVALGARPAHVVRVVLAAGLAPTAVGIVLGLAGAAAVVGVARRILYGISPYDPATFTLAPLVLVAVAVVACLGPARRALRTDPLGALRQD